ncbi:uncharacterized protein [Haliotis cracherodii]|uniref:uncharacterized protein n=1 Tax=Haliotis cracherodii TaxID=6455 RepID=UPI0039EBEED4
MMSLERAMKGLGGIHSLFLVIQHGMLGPFIAICTALTALFKIFESLSAVFNIFNGITGKKRPGPNTSHHDPPPRAEINVVGKTISGYSSYVQTTGVDAEAVSDVTKALRGVQRLNTVGITRGSAGTVVTTGIRIRSTQNRARDRLLRRSGANTEQERD